MKNSVMLMKNIDHRSLRARKACFGTAGIPALAERLAGAQITAASAGSHPKTLHPNAVRVMREYGVDITGRQAKHISTFAGQYFDYVVSLCDRVREVCPEFPGHPEMIHWSIPDPAGEGGSDRETYPAFRAVAADLHTRIGYLLRRLGHAGG